MRAGRTRKRYFRPRFLPRTRTADRVNAMTIPQRGLLLMIDYELT